MLIVEESFKYKFTGEHNGIFRDYKINGCDGYSIDKVTIIDKHGNEIIATEGYDEKDNTYELKYDNTYLKLYTKSKNESKTIKFEYTIYGAAKKYKDCSAIYWNFYDVPEGTRIKAGTLNISLEGQNTLKKISFIKCTEVEKLMEVLRKIVLT